jgi:predicted Zn-dependent protease
MFLFISITAFDMPKLPGSGAMDVIKALPVPDSMKPSVPPVLVASVGNAIYNWEVGRRTKESDKDVSDRMDQIFDRLKAAALTHPTYGAVAKEIEWKLNTLREQKPATAAAFPGGGIAIYDGVFPIAQYEGVLASILGHEMAHLLAKHHLQRMNSDVAAAVMTIGPAIASGTNPDKLDPKIIGPVAGAMGIGYLSRIPQLRSA